MYEIIVTNTVEATGVPFFDVEPNIFENGIELFCANAYGCLAAENRFVPQHSNTDISIPTVTINPPVFPITHLLHQQAVQINKQYLLIYKLLLLLIYQRVPLEDLFQDFSFLRL